MNWDLWDLGWHDGAGINTPMLLEDQDYKQGYSAGVSCFVKNMTWPKYKSYQHNNKRHNK